jgi:glycosyltransferase involved in cell wall biosynthesis
MENPPFFSIAIPTRNRSHLARDAATHVLSQDFRDFELIILDNSDRRDLTTTEFSDARCKVLPSPMVLSMRDNWERTMDAANGKYVMVLSDKDMLLPGALRRLATAIAKTDANMINYRKACFSLEGPFQSFVQLCSGQLVERDGKEVLRAWFEDVAHFHDAPMIYNSAVRRDVLMELRGISGDFFVGASPDIGSGMLLMARLEKYHVLDRPLAVSWFGDWSIGMASVLGGQGAAAVFLSEYRGDPLRDVGLVNGLPGGVAETALACKGRFASLFHAYHIRWSTYVRNVLAELKKKEGAGIDVSAERNFLLSGRGKEYSGLAARVGQAKFHWANAALPMRIRGRVKLLSRWPGKMPSSAGSSQPLPSKNPTTSSDSADRDLARYFNIPLPGVASFRNVTCFSLPWASSVTEVEHFATDVNDRLDALILRK